MSFCESSKVEVRAKKQRQYMNTCTCSCWNIKACKQTNKQTYLSGTHNTNYLPLFFSFLVGETLFKGGNQKCKIPKLCHLVGGEERGRGGAKKGKKERKKSPDCSYLLPLSK
jgi:hypothetical protein